MRNIALFLLALLKSSFILASSITDTTVTMLMLDQAHGDKLYIKTEKIHAVGNPSCHTSTWSFVLALKTPLQEKFYSTLLAAQTAGKKVNLTGYGNCGVHDGIETLRRIEYK